LFFVILTLKSKVLKTIDVFEMKFFKLTVKTFVKVYEQKWQCYAPTDYTFLSSIPFYRGILIGT